MEKRSPFVGDPASCGLSVSRLSTPHIWSKPAASEQAGTPLTVVTYNASHFYWNRKYTMNEAAAYIKQLQPDIICFQEAPGDGYYHRDSIRYAFDYVLYKYISRRTDHLPTTIYSRYPIHSVKALYYENSSNMSLIADVRINNQYIRVINNHFETTSVNAYRGIITAPGKSLKVRAKAVQIFDLENEKQLSETSRTSRFNSCRDRTLVLSGIGLWRLQRYARFLYVPSVTERLGRWFP